MGIIVADAPDINNIQHNIDRARQNYAVALKQVHDVAPLKVSLPLLIEFNEEFGAEHAVRLLQENPRRFGLAGNLEPDAAETLSNALDTLNGRTETLDELFAKREDILCAADPTRLRRYCIDGRECIVDAISNTITFLDDPERAYRLEPVRTKDTQEIERRDLENERDYEEDEPRF